jgi:hypothetical protein
MYETPSIGFKKLQSKTYDFQTDTLMNIEKIGVSFQFNYLFQFSKLLTPKIKSVLQKFDFKKYQICLL